MFLYSNLVYFFFIIYVQHYPKLSYQKYYKIIRALHRQLTSFTTMVVEYGHRVCQFHQVTLVAFTETRRCSKDAEIL